MTISKKLIGTVLVVLALAFGFLAWLVDRKARQALVTQAAGELEGLRTSRGRLVEWIVQRKIGSVRSVAVAIATQQMLREMPAAIDRLPDQLSRAVDEAVRGELRAFYDREVGPRMLRAGLPWSGADPYLSLRNPSLLRQAEYIARNPNEPGERKRLVNAAHHTDYDALHGLYQERVLRWLEAFGWDDAFLVDDQGNVIYSARKEIDFGTNLRTDAMRDTPLAEAFFKAVAAPEPNQVHFQDYARYQPSNGLPGSFMSAPVLDSSGALLGVFAVRVAASELNAFLTDHTGLKETGETYLVGPDFMMRTDSRFSQESTILTRKVDTE